jgi:DNA helicase HerA-like ATPase
MSKIGRSGLPYDVTLAGIPLFREAETDHILVCGAPGSGKGVAIKELLDQIRARGDRAILYDPSGEYVQVVLPSRPRRAAQSPGCEESTLDLVG